MKVFISRKIPQPGIEKLKKAGIEVMVWTESRPLSQPELISFCKKCDGFLSAGYDKIDRFFLQQCRHLKVVSLHSVGYDRVDVAAANELKIPVGNTPGVVSEATADVAFMLMLSVTRKAFYMHHTIREGEWKFFEPTANLGIEIKGKTLGIFGLGHIGYQMAKRCVGAYNMQVIYHNRHRNWQAEKDLQAGWVSFDDLLQKSDVLSVHCNLTDETKNKFDKNAFEKMKPSSVFINTSRGGVHNEADLIDALENGIIWGAGLDVTNPEPMEKDNPLLTMPNAAVLPHIGSATEETRNQMARLAAENIIAGLNGKRLPFPVNPEIYD